MLYEAVYWRSIAQGDPPYVEAGFADPEVKKTLADWGVRAGDTAVVAQIDSKLVGAAWYRYWTDGNAIRGYIEDTVPVLIMGIHRDVRRQGIGKQLLERLMSQAAQDNIQTISLMVAKGNHASHLYRKCGFVEYADRGDSLLMWCKTY
jgi:ribosomal protein S18 acetylase RimI-like enzyme